jgi:hypothetical protein
VSTVKGIKVSLYRVGGTLGLRLPEFLDNRPYTPVIFVPQEILLILISVGDRGSTVLRYCATNRKVVGSIQDGVIGFFIDINPSDRTVALGSTQLLIEMSTRSMSWG